MSESPYIKEITTENFADAVIEASFDVPVLVDFWAEWCQPCKMLMPILAQLAEEYQGKFILAKLNTEEQQALAAQFGIRSIPTVKLFKDGQPVDEFMGALPESELRRFLDQHIPRASDNLIAQADSALQQGAMERAEELLTRAGHEDPDNPRIQLVRIQLMIQRGDLEGAQSIIEGLPLDQQMDTEVANINARLKFARITRDAPPPETLEPHSGVSSEAAFQLAAHRVMQGDYATALQLLLELLKRDRGYGDDAPRKAMLSVFDLLGSDHPLVGQYRSRMFNALH